MQNDLQKDELVVDNVELLDETIATEEVLNDTEEELGLDDFEDDEDFDQILERINEERDEELRQGIVDIVKLLDESMDKLKVGMSERLADIKAKRKAEMATDEYKKLSKDEKKLKRDKYKLQKEYFEIIAKNINEVRTQRPLINFIKEKPLLAVLANHKNLVEEYKKFRSYRRRHKFNGMNLDSFIEITKKNKHSKEHRAFIMFAYALLKYANHLDKENKGMYLQMRMTYFLYTTMMLNVALANPSSANSKLVQRIVNSFHVLENK